MYSDYGSHCFYVMLPKEKCIQIPDPYEVDSSVLVYKTEDAPEMIPLEDDG